MKVFDATAIRNVALVGHSGSGKTQLAAALLYDAGAVTRLLDDGPRQILNGVLPC